MSFVNDTESEGEESSFLSPSTSRQASTFTSPSFASPSKRTYTKLPVLVDQELFLIVEKFGPKQDTVLSFEKDISERPVFHLVQRKPLHNRYNYLSKLSKSNPTKYYQIRDSVFANTPSSIQQEIQSPIPASIKTAFTRVVSPLPTISNTAVTRAVTPLPTLSNSSAIMSDHLKGMYLV
jgi:hypothetical protein